MKTHICLLLSFLLLNVSLFAQQEKPAYQLIAHRGGIVEGDSPENSLAALEKAIQRGYYMVEVDMRITKDSVPVTHHDTNLKRYFGVDREVSDMTWEEISRLEGPYGHKVQKLEEVLQYCEGKIRVMLDNKIRGFDEALFTRVYDWLEKYSLDQEALMIGTTASTDFFTGKIKLSCTRQQLEENRQKPGYDPGHYYFFSKDISREDYLWAKQKDIMVVGVVNTWTFRSNDPMEEAKEAAEQLKAAGIQYFQIDSVYEPFFR